MNSNSILPTGRLRPEGLSEELVRAVVDDFYLKARADDLLGPVFNSVIAPDEWPDHLATIAAFWSSMLLGTRRYGGRPMPKHVVLPLTDAHFRRWLDLFRETVEALCPPETAALFVERAERAGHSFRLGHALARGIDTTSMEPIRAAAPVR